MKVTFVDEIEVHKSWFASMYCSKCDEGMYRIHHQIQPDTPNSWWIECPNCGHETTPVPTRDLALAGWKNEC